MAPLSTKPAPPAIFLFVLTLLPKPRSECSRFWVPRRRSLLVTSHELSLPLASCSQHFHTSPRLCTRAMRSLLRDCYLLQFVTATPRYFLSQSASTAPQSSRYRQAISSCLSVRCCSLRRCESQLVARLGILNHMRLRFGQVAWPSPSLTVPLFSFPQVWRTCCSKAATSLASRGEHKWV